MDDSGDRFSPEWGTVERLYGEARKRLPRDRVAYVEAACAGKSEIQVELLSLLTHTDAAEAFFGRLQEHVFSNPLWAEAEGADGMSDDDPAPELPPGTMLGRYRVMETIGAGGMGTVYRAHDPALDRDVALKLLPLHLSVDPASRERFLIEARMAAALDHPNICTIHEVGEAEDGRLFLAMACYEGTTLKDRLETGPLPVHEAVEYMTQLAGALAAAHTAGIVHRDVKPGNVMLLPDGTVKLLDFGLARMADVTLTRPGLTRGTVAYMSPEQGRGERMDHRTDLFSLGIVLYEMLAGARPFRGGSDGAVLAAIGHRAPEPLTSLRPETPESVARAVDRLLEKDPDARYRTAGELLAELEPGQGVLAASQLVPGKPSSPVRRRGRAWRRMAGLAAGSAVLGLLAWLIAQGPLRGGGEIHSVAVLPLTNLTGDPQQEYFLAGMHAGLVADLSHFDGLRVVAPQSVLGYQDSDLPLPVIAGELGVDALVLGSVLLLRDSIRISVRVVRASPEEHLWEDTYQDALEKGLALQGRIAGAVARAIEAQVAPQEQARLAGRLAVDPQAQEAYLNGLYHLERQASMLADRLPEVLETLRTSIGHLEQAVSLEPEWAAAHAKLAEAYHWLASRFGPTHGAEFFPKSKAAALRALELDESESQAHASLGFVLYEHEWDWAGADRAFRRALELDLNSHHHAYALFLRAVGQHDEAIVHLRLAEERNPVSEVVKVDLAWALSCAGRYDEAIAQFRELERRIGSGARPDQIAWMGQSLARAYLRQSRHAEAIEEAERAVVLTDSLPMTLVSLAETYAHAGRPDLARAVLARLEERLDGRIGWPAQLFAVLGETERAVAMVEEAFEATNQTGGMSHFRCTETYRLLAHDPRIQAIVRRIGYPE